MHSQYCYWVKLLAQLPPIFCIKKGSVLEQRLAKNLENLSGAKVKVLLKVVSTLQYFRIFRLHGKSRS